MVVAHNDETRPVAIRTGNFELRLAESDAEIEAAQALRYRVFYEEMAAAPTAEMAAARRDFDGFDRHCDHLLVIDHRHGVGAAGVVGTYRLLRRSGAARAGRFY
jgi:putative hemolysin